MISVIVRGANHLPVSQLELGACAFVPYAIAIYIASHPKPKGPQAATIIKTFPVGLPPSLKAKWDACECESFKVIIDGRKSHNHGGAITNSTYHSLSNADSSNATVAFALPVLLSIPFGAIHLVAWNFEFPTVIDAQLWRIASIIITAALPTVMVTLPTIAIVGVLTGLLDDDRIGADNTSLAFGWAIRLMIAFFFLSRLVIIVEMFRTLAYLPPGAYANTGSMNVPHIG